jgi:hypothetical protein
MSCVGRFQSNCSYQLCMFPEEGLLLARFCARPDTNKDGRNTRLIGRLTRCLDLVPPAPIRR